jgi:hypothetical protein
MAAKAAFMSYARPTTFCQITPAPLQPVKEPPPFHNQIPSFLHQFTQADRAAQATATLPRSGRVDTVRMEHVALGSDSAQQDPALATAFALTSRASPTPGGGRLREDLLETDPFQNPGA